ncbi:hypothetical protein ACFQ3S_11005 [Mucilaginibacter terrae]|uniref:hypothetical protein n=1 Tax=Mucilaginibacter terrae TaxID=1955052 RepID=UPI003636278E
MKKLTIKQGQYLEHIAPLIPTNVILLKVLTGIGATTLEIKSKRSSIIMEPNVPVIKGKKKKGVMCIYEGVTVDMVIDYMDSSIKYKKIIVTPESFFKVKEAAEYLSVSIYEEYFFLFDECDRTIKDVNFRKKIILPIEDFFLFKHKAFVSATALIPSDPRFAEQGFETITIEPDFDYSKPINLITTNNVFLSFKKVVEENPDEVFCVFLNSTNMIGSFVKSMDINNFSNIYCSRESFYQLKANNFKHVSEHLTDHNIFNFFTSRFYSAVDIPMDVKPTVILLTDLVSGVHSMIHPRTEAVQAVGRFRNGVNKIYHIANLNEELQPKSKEAAAAYLQGCENSYYDVKALHQAATEQGAKDSLKVALDYMPYALFLNANGSKNFFMEDNFYLEEEIKSGYISAEAFIKSYNIPHFVATHASEQYPLTDENASKLKPGISMKIVVDSVIETLEEVNRESDLYTLDNKQTVYNELLKSFPIIVQAYNELGVDTLKKNGFSKKQILKALKRHTDTNQKAHFGFLETLHDMFDDGADYPSAECRRLLEIAVNKYSLTLRPTLKLLEEYFKLSNRKTLYRDKLGRDIKGYTIIRSKFNRQ